jgi:hypothetical protein
VEWQHGEISAERVTAWRLLGAEEPRRSSHNAIVATPVGKVIHQIDQSM